MGWKIWDWGIALYRWFKKRLSGIANAFKDTMNNAKRFIMGKSPPKEGPLRETNGGLTLVRLGLVGFLEVLGKLGSLVNQSLSPLQDVMGYGGVNMAGVDQMVVIPKTFI